VADIASAEYLLQTDPGRSRVAARAAARTVSGNSTVVASIVSCTAFNSHSIASGPVAGLNDCWPTGRPALPDPDETSAALISPP
jgi:hypothetical protein